MIIGQARTGKTSLKKSLKGELFDPDEGRTEGIETDPSYFKVTTDVWRTASNSEDTETEAEFLLDRQVAQNIAKGIKEEELLGDPSTSKTKPSVKDFKVVERPEANSSLTERSEESGSNRIKPSLQDSKEVENAKAPPLRRTASNSENTETEAEFLLDRQVTQNIAKGIKEEERLGDPSTSKTKASVKDFKVVERPEANSPPPERLEESGSNRIEPSLQDSKEVENAKAPPLRRTASNSEDTETEAEFLLDRQVAQNIAKGIKEEELLGDPSTSKTKASVKDFKVVERPEANSPPPERLEESGSNRIEPSLQDSKEVENAKAPPLRTEPSVEPEQPKTSSSVTEQSESDRSPQNSKDHQKVPGNVAALVEELLKGNKKFIEGDDMYSVIWDFGGQSVFYDTHPIFLTEKAIYILTCDLSCDPHHKADTPVKKGRYRKIQDNDCEKTNFDYLDFWMSSIYSLVSNNTDRQETSSPETLPAVFLACTHADEPYTTEGNPSKEIFGALRDKIYGSLLEDFFVVDNTKSGSNEECEGVKNLREAVLSVAAELPQMKVPIPLKWLRYEKVLYLLMRKEGLAKISIEDARKIASDNCGIDGDENVRAVLDFLHGRKVLINFSESPELARMVILNPQWLVDVLKEVITFKCFNHRDKRVQRHWLDFENSGILERELLDHVWGRFTDDQETCESLIEIMEKFSLLCQWPSEGTTEQYLVPSMLKSCPTSEFPDVQTPSLFVRFKSGRVPPGLFSRLILRFHHWVRDKWTSQSPSLFSNYALFHIVPQDGISAAFLCHSSFIEIVFSHKGDFLDERHLNISHGIHQQLGLILEGMRKEFFWLKHMNYTLSVACSVCSGEKDSNCYSHKKRGCDCLHLFSEEELKSPFCSKKNPRTSCRVDVEKFHLWFSSQVC